MVELQRLVCHNGSDMILDLADVREFANFHYEQDQTMNWEMYLKMDQLRTDFKVYQGLGWLSLLGALSTVRVRGPHDL